MKKNYFKCFKKHKVYKSFMGWLYNFEESGELIFRRTWVNIRIKQLNKIYK